MSRTRKKKLDFKFVVLIVIILLTIVAGSNSEFLDRNFNEDLQTTVTDKNEVSQDNYESVTDIEKISQSNKERVSLDTVPDYSDLPYAIINDNIPYFTNEELTTKSYEEYGVLDNLGRCTVAIASVGKDLMPTEDRGNISSVKPTGWQVAKYDFVDGKYLYNRCHLIGFQLTGENANEQNLITGTRYMNVQGMLPFENMIADYVKETGNHVLYRVTPIFEGDNLVASGVLMEAKSVEDDGEGIEFNVYCYNVQPGVEIDYATGNSSKVDIESTGEEHSYILNTNSKKFHELSCSGVNSISEKNKSEYTGTRETLILQGYTPCGICNP